MSRFFSYTLLACLLAGPGTSLSQASNQKQTYVAIIIDDVGNNRARGQRAIRLPGPVTLSILPNTSFTRQLSLDAHAAHKEVMLHLPMENVGNLQALGPSALTDRLSKAEFLERLSSAIKQVPFARGLNNHTGSYLTQQTEQMNWLMDDIKRRDFFFIDSRTTAKSVAHRIAKEKSVLSASRDIFLDNEKSLFAIHKEFLKLIKVAKKKGTAIAIGHPHEATLTYLESALPHLKRLNVTMIPASNLIALQQIQALANKARLTSAD